MSAIFSLRRCAILTLSAAALLSSSAMAGGSPRRISGQHEGNCFNPIMSPDGKQVAYEVNYFDRRVIELYLYGMDTGRETQVMAAGGGGGIMGEFQASGAVNSGMVNYELAWSPTRSNIFVYSSSGANENFDIYLSSGAPLASHLAADGMPTWSNDGMLLAFTSSRTGEGDIYILDISKIEEKPMRLTSFSDSTEWYPTWSKSGHSLVYVRHYSKGGDNLFLVNDVKKPTEPAIQLTRWPSIQTKPAWSPDGTKVAFYSNRSSKERYDLYLVDARADAEPRVLLEGVIPAERRGPSWTPDGRALMVVKDAPEQFNPIRLVSIDVPAKSKTVSTGTQNNGDLQIALTQDGKQWLVFTAQGLLGDRRKSFKNAYVYPLDKNDLTF